jgi:hypothetical protein
MTLTPDSLAVDLWPRVGYADPDDLIDAWRQVHHAAQALVHLGKSWGEPRADDAHSALEWSDEDAGWLSEGSGPLGSVIGWLDLGGASLWLERRTPQEGAWIELDGRTIEALTAWTKAAAERLSGGGAKQAAAPAPDLPDHPAASGQRLQLDDPDARGDLESLYEGAGLLLSTLREALGNAHGAADDDATPRVWPHHFDAASLFVVARDEHGNMSRTIGVGLAPPDTVEPSGYWYVSPWAAEQDAPGPGPDPLPHGRWHPRGDSLPMAILPLSEMTPLADGDDQHARIASFVAAAFNASLEILDAR